MKVSFYFALRELRRRPRRAISMLLVAVAIMTALNMLLFYLEANWRAEVMPDNERNYHLKFREVTAAERAYIVTQPWVQAYYDVDVENHYGEYQYYELRVRVDWDNVLRVNALARQMFDDLDLWHSEYYADNYARYEKQVRQSMQMSWKPWETERNGMTFDQWLVQNTKASFIRNVPENSWFCRLTVDSYIMRPEFAMYMGLFACFLGSVTAILFSEQYRANLSEYGTMRACGMKKKQIIFINCIETAIINLAAIPAAFAVTGIIVLLYNLCTRWLNDGTVWLTMGDYLPLGAMAIVSAMQLAVSLAGCLGICMLHRNMPVMSLLRGIEAQRVSFVSKTSPRFERAGSLAVYDRLYLTRTRETFALNALILALMLPLPIYYLHLAVSMFGQDLTAGELLIGIYHMVQAVLLIATSVTVTFVATHQSCEGRTHEFAVMRALGCKRRRITVSAYVQAVMQAVITAALATAFFLYLSDTNQHISSLPTGQVITIGALLAKIAVCVLGAAALIVPPGFGGIAAALRRFFKRSTIVNLREYEN